MIEFNSMQQRYSILILFPVAILLLAIGYLGFSYSHRYLLDQWGEVSILKLQRAAHFIDMRLGRPKDLLNQFHRTAGLANAITIEEIILDQIRSLGWVARVNLKWLPGKENGFAQSRSRYRDGSNGRMMPRGMMGEGFGMMRFSRGMIADITPPHFDSSTGSETISLISELKNESDQVIGRIEVAIYFDRLIKTPEVAGWWKEHKAYLVDDTGAILASNLKNHEKKLGENGSHLERSLLDLLKSNSFGTVFDSGFQPQEVIGFYKLKEAPWTLVIIAPGQKILSSIIRFSLYYLSFGSVSVLTILILIRWVTGRTVRSIKTVSAAAHTVAQGDYHVSLPAKTRDEVGDLIRSFNTMVNQLEDRARLKYSLNLAMEVQQNLLPEKSMQFGPIEIAGQSLYCDETGGDYYDFLPFPGAAKDRIAVAVGDVSDHGVASALLMASARAMLRTRMKESGTLSEIITDVNELLCSDTDRTGNFMTLFFLVLDSKKRELQWVRAGHEPAILYDAAKDDFVDLGGPGIALGVIENCSYKEQSIQGWHSRQIIIVGTDGVWEAENQQGEAFGKERVREVIRRASHLSASQILQTISNTLADFRQNAPQKDDITLVAIKLNSLETPRVS